MSIPLQWLYCLSRCPAVTKSLWVKQEQKCNVGTVAQPIPFTRSGLFVSFIGGEKQLWFWQHFLETGDCQKHTSVTYSLSSSMFVFCSFVKILVLPKKWKKSVLSPLSGERKIDMLWPSLCFFYDQAPERSKQPFCHSQEIATIHLKDTYKGCLIRGN